MRAPTICWTDVELSKFRHALEDEGKSEHTIRAYLSDVSQFLEHCDSVQVYADNPIMRHRATEWLGKSKKVVGPATVNRRMASVKTYFRLVHSKDVLERYKAPSPPPGQPHPLPNLMDDVRAMLAVTKPHSDARLAIALMGFAGLRVTEARTLTWAQIEHDWLVINGKGSKIRYVPVAPELQVVIDQHHCPDVSMGPMMDITDRGIRGAVTRTGVRAGISRPVASHDLRMTFGTVIYDKTKDLRVTQELLGHASPTTTERYTGISEDTKMQAIMAAVI